MTTNPNPPPLILPHGTTVADSHVRRSDAPQGVGQRARKVDGVAKATGKARYTDDLSFPGMLHAKLKRSPHAHARIVNVDARAALLIPGVRAVITGADLPEAQRKAHQQKLLKLFKQATRELKRGTDIFSDRNLQESMLQMSKCPDLVINKGHYFGTDLFAEKDEPGLTDAEKTDLIAFLKRM